MSNQFWNLGFQTSKTNAATTTPNVQGFVLIAGVGPYAHKHNLTFNLDAETIRSFPDHKFFISEQKALISSLLPLLLSQLICAECFEAKNE